jgi:hypothetical protein
MLQLSSGDDVLSKFFIQKVFRKEAVSRSRGANAETYFVYVAGGER